MSTANEPNTNSIYQQQSASLSSEWEEAFKESVAEAIDQPKDFLAFTEPAFYIPALGEQEGLITLSCVKPQHLTFGPCGICIDLDTGNVTMPDTLDLTDAARAFWEAVMRMTGQRCGFD